MFDVYFNEEISFDPPQHYFLIHFEIYCLIAFFATSYFSKKMKNTYLFNNVSFFMMIIYDFRSSGNTKNSEKNATISIFSQMVCLIKSFLLPWNLFFILKWSNEQLLERCAILIWWVVMQYLQFQIFERMTLILYNVSPLKLTSTKRVKAIEIQTVSKYF